MSADDDDAALVREMGEREELLEAVSNGCPPELAAFRLGWTPRKMREVMQEPEFVELIQFAAERSVDAIEEVLQAKALAGNMAAIQMVLYNRRAHTWRDVRRIEVRTEATVSIQQVESTKQAAIALLRERGAGALQLLSGADDIVDAEVVDGGD